MTNRAGYISEIFRYPVKSFSGERLETGIIQSHGLYGDRHCAIYDETKEGWNRFVTARNLPRMLLYSASLVDDRIRVISPEGKIFGWDDQLLEEMQQYSKRTISLSPNKAPHPENAALLSVDTASLLIVTNNSVSKLEALWGKKLDVRRFRANFVVTAADETINEQDWIGKRLLIGETELVVDEPCERCMMITIDPDTLERDASLLKIVNKQMDLTFGVYASVRRTGRIQAGEQVIICD